MATASASFETELNDFLIEGAKRRNASGSRWHRLMSGEESDDAMKVGVVQYYFHTLGFTNALRYLYARCDIPELREEIAEGLYEEETGGITGTASHIELYFRMAEAFDISRDKLLNEARIVPEMAGIVHWYHYAATSLSVLEGLAVLNFAAEGQNVDIDDYKGSSTLTLEVLKDRYKMTGDALTFNEVHAIADQEHCAVGARNLARYADTEEQRARIRTAILMTFDAWGGNAAMTERYTLDDCWLPGNASSVFYQ